MSRRKTLPDTPNATSSPGSADGPLLCDLLGYETTSPCGPAPALASLSARQALAEGLMTRATYGPPSDGSSTSADLQRPLESRLRARLDVNGSPEYVLTWKRWDMASGPSICALRASARRTSDSGCGGWPSTTVGNATGSQAAKGASLTGRRPDGSKVTVSLNMVAQAVGWPTATARDHFSANAAAQRKNPNSQHHSGTTLTDAARFAGWGTPTAAMKVRSAEQQEGRALNPAEVAAGWATPTSRDHKDGEFCPNVPTNCLLGRQAWTTGSPAQTEKRGALNPALSRWLMGYPAEWDSCGATAMQSFHRSRRK